MTKLARVAIVLGVILLASGLFLYGEAERVLAAKLEVCGADDPANKVRASFDIPQARSIRAYLPGMLDNPELQTDLPASVVVFEGPTILRLAGSPRRDGAPAIQESTYDGVVCVLIGDDPIVYVDVDTSDLRVP